MKCSGFQTYGDTLLQILSDSTKWGEAALIACGSFRAQGDGFLEISAESTEWKANSKLILEASDELAAGDRILDLRLGDGPGYAGAPLGAGRIPVRIWHKNTNDQGQSYAVWISTNSQYEDHGSGLVVHNYGKSDGITVSTYGGADGGCGIGVINKDDYRNSYGISMSNMTGRSIVIGQRGTGEGIELRRVWPDTTSGRVPGDERPASGAHIFVFNSATDSQGAHDAGHLAALYADASRFADNDDPQIKLTQKDSQGTEHPRFEVAVDGSVWTDGALRFSGSGHGWSVQSNAGTLEIMPDSCGNQTRSVLLKPNPQSQAKPQLEVQGHCLIGSASHNASISSIGHLSFTGQGGIALPVKDVTPGTTTGTQFEAVIDTAEARVYINWNGGTQWKYLSLRDP